MTISSSAKGGPEDPEEPEIVVTAEVIPQNEESAPLQPSALPQPEKPGTTSPLPSAQKPKRHVDFDVMCCGDDMRAGIRVRPGKNYSIKLCGNTHIMLPKEPPQGAHYKFFIVNLCGDARFYVPKSTNVMLRRISLCGNRKIDQGSEEDVDPSAIPTSITVTIAQLCGDVRIMNLEEECQEE